MQLWRYLFLVAFALSLARAEDTPPTVAPGQLKLFSLTNTATSARFSS